MDKRFKYKYRIESSRLKNYDYSKEGFYFITILTKNREHFFGEIINNKMVLSDLGKIAVEEWLISEKLRKNIYLDQWIVMPNHIHGIVIIDYSDRENKHQFKKSDFSKTPNKSYTEKRLKIYNGENPDLSKISPIPNSISTMIRFFKRQVKMRSKENNFLFDWQERFDDRIIRDEKSLFAIRTYIKNNVINWKNEEDKF